MNRKISSDTNLFVYGMSGSGKDSISDYMKSSYGYNKLRIAHTIKQVITEQLNISFDELEILKRDNPEIRDLHHEVSKRLGNEVVSLNRLKLIIEQKSMDFQLIEKYKPTVICDCRTYDEAITCLNAGWTGIFLTRLTNEYKKSDHYTEQNMFFNGQLIELCKVYSDQMYFIDNDQVNNFLELTNFCFPVDKTFKTDGTLTDLLVKLVTIIEVIKKIKPFWNGK